MGHVPLSARILIAVMVHLPPVLCMFCCVAQAAGEPGGRGAQAAGNTQRQARLMTNLEVSPQESQGGPQPLSSMLRSLSPAARACIGKSYSL